MEKNVLTPRGQAMSLPHGSLPEIYSLHLQKLIAQTGGALGPIGLQFVARPELERKHFNTSKLDPLNEDHYEVAPGLVYKYKGKKGKNGRIDHYGRVLWTVTRYCSSYCRFCTRGREVGYMGADQLNSHAALANKAYLDADDLNKVGKFLNQHPEINEIILSGGDPLTVPQKYFAQIMDLLSRRQKAGKLDIIRIGTRLPVHNPDGIRDWHFEQVARLENPYLMVHINHPAELTPETLAILKKFRQKTLATVMSQSVFLKGVNDNLKTLVELFNTLAKNGVRPYYLFQNDEVCWAPHFTVPIQKAIKLWSQLRPKLSGVAATAKFVIDVPNGIGKIPLPEGDAWDVSYQDGYRDFQGTKFGL